jgi:murein DD-endopeptidase MepM/ murein hydrolase activator NlpD
LFLRGPRIQSLTVLIVRDGGRGSWSLRLPRFLPAGISSFGLLVLYLAALVGFQAQALLGLSGPHVEIALASSMRERWGGFTRMAPTVLGPTRAELTLGAARARAQRLGLGSRKTASSLWLGNVAPEWLKELGATRSPGTLAWPVEGGMYGRGFGSGSNGYHLAVDIDGRLGSNVVASAAGTVGYVGNELKGYGNLVMLIHRGGWITLYAHNKRLLVVAGQRIAQGQPIAELGSTGRSMGPHVHFELIHEGRNCDPLPLFRFASDRPGRLPEVALAQWQPDSERPSAVRCARRKDHPHPSHDLDDPEIDHDDSDLNADAKDTVGPMAFGG